jgi:DnaD/phage-associated family protein
MISKTVTQTHRFLRLPLEAQALYFHLIQNCDDDGVVEAFPILRMIGANEDNLGLLVIKQFVKPLNDEMVYFVVDFHKQNIIRKDRYVPSVYKKLLENDVEESNSQAITYNSTSDVSENSHQMTTTGKPNDNQMTTTGCPNISKDNISKDNISKGKSVEENKSESNLSEYKAVEVEENKKLSSSATAHNPNDLSGLIDSETSGKNVDFNLAEYYQEQIGVLSGSQLQRLEAYQFVDGMETELIKIAIDKAADNSKRSFGYVEAILKNWAQNGIKTVAQQEEDQRQFEMSKNPVDRHKPFLTRPRNNGKAKFGPACGKY